MPNVAPADNQSTLCANGSALCATSASLAAIVVLVAGMTAAWFAAGSTGLLGSPLQHSLTWLALAIAIIVGWPRNNTSFLTWAILAIGTALGFSFTASNVPAVNVLAVVVVLASLAQVGRGLDARIALIASYSAGALALFRLACDSIPAIWLVAAAGRPGWNQIARLLTGNQLDVGQSFGGVDFLVLTAAVYAGCFLCTPATCRRTIGWTAIAGVIGHLVYIAVLANSENLLAALPKIALPPESDVNNVGLWTIGNGLRTLIPWNLPLLAVAIHCAIVAVMYRAVEWLPIVEPDPKELEKQKEKELKQDIPGSVLAADMLFRFGPVLVAVILALTVSLAVSTSNLRNKTVVAYEKGYVNWLKPEHDSPTDGFCGMLPAFVESLGGKFVKSPALSDQDLAAADVLLLIHPDEPWPKEFLERIWKYVSDGGSLLLVADPVIREGDSSSTFNDVLKPTAMRVRYDTAVTRTGNWEQSCQVMSHPAVVGLDDFRNRFGLELGSSIRVRFPARPVLVGRWGWSDPGSDAAATGEQPTNAVEPLGNSSYNAGEPLGDLVLAAEQSFGSGRIFVLGGVSPLRNEMLANSYPFVGRLFGYLADKPSSPQAIWRQLLGIVALFGLAALLVLRPAAWQMILAPSVLAVSVICCTSAGFWAGRVLPDGRTRAESGFNNVAYIDASHVEAYSGDLWANHGLAGLTRTLMRDGYLPLFAPDLSRERLDRAGLLISIAPARSFSTRQREAISKFVSGGGAFICMVGAEQSRPISPLLEDFDFRVPPSQVPPNENSAEPYPLGALYGRSVEGNWQVRYYVAWPVESPEGDAQRMVYWTNDPIDCSLASIRSAGGSVAVIADTHFASNENMDLDPAAANRFWRWLLSRVTPGRKPWDPPADAKDAAPPSNQEDDSNIEK